MLSSVLIVDKRKELSIKYKKSIDEAEINTVIARKLSDALVILQTLEPDMIIISDSIEEELADFCQKIRALTYNTRPIIIALSKSAESEDRIKVLENGADDFISEPVNIEEFKSRIKAHLRRNPNPNRKEGCNFALFVDGNIWTAYEIINSNHIKNLGVESFRERL